MSDIQCRMDLTLRTFLCLLLFHSSNGVKILGLFTMTSHSHFSVGYRLMSELAERGHDVTLVSPYPQKVKKPNLTDISVEDTIDRVNMCKYSPHFLKYFFKKYI